MTTALVPTALPAVPDLIRTFLGGRSPHTLTAYGRDLDDFAQFLTGTRREALGRFFAQPAPAANAEVLRYRWFGKRQTCRLPTPEEKSRFLD
ncbi:MAG: hypothetical protein CL477_09410 [Acidobacteria bacterium]|jgi:hypothetical protein|nr:hypothetical protein [Acidobacteriota bacterium]MDP7690262.1 hypothetical protein [Vicinamibacterales bacterium]HJN46835.1 hypothetical protein [Vicinamibacterales bacterium]|tara:strand:+ start:1308 stop:1583 length:276 start_codon:yes stop_codon:yes gene_type:complete